MYQLLQLLNVQACEQISQRWTQVIQPTCALRKRSKNCWTSLCSKRFASESGVWSHLQSKMVTSQDAAWTAQPWRTCQLAMGERYKHRPGTGRNRDDLPQRTDAAQCDRRNRKHSCPYQAGTAWKHGDLVNKKDKTCAKVREIKESPLESINVALVCAEEQCAEVALGIAFSRFLSRIVLLVRVKEVVVLVKVKLLNQFL